MTAQHPEIERAADVRVALRPGSGGTVPRVEHPKQVIVDKDRGSRERLRAKALADHEEREHITDCDLLEHTDKTDAPPVGTEVIEHDADDNQTECSSKDVPEALAPRIPPRCPPRQREGHCHSDHVHEGRLDEIPVDAPFPLDMLVLEVKPVPGRMVPERSEDGPTQERYHDQTAIRIERFKTRERRTINRGSSPFRRTGRERLVIVAVVMVRDSCCTGL